MTNKINSCNFDKQIIPTNCDNSNNNLPLPLECIFQIFSHLEINDLVNVAKVCKNWKIISECDHLWKSHFLKQVGPSLINQGFKLAVKLHQGVQKFKSEVEKRDVTHHNPNQIIEILDQNSQQRFWEAFAVIRMRKERYQLSNHDIQMFKYGSLNDPGEFLTNSYQTDFKEAAQTL